MTVTAHVRSRAYDPPKVVAAEVVEGATDPVHPSIVLVDGFGLYGVGLHPEFGPFAAFLAPTPGLDPEPAPCELVDGRLEVRLLGDVLHLVVEGHPVGTTTVSATDTQEGTMSETQGQEQAGQAADAAQSQQATGSTPEQAATTDAAQPAEQQTTTTTETTQTTAPAGGSEGGQGDTGQ